MVTMDEMIEIVTTNHGGGYNRLYLNAGGDIGGVATVVVAVEASN